MLDKAGTVFHCVLCKQDKPESEASFDPQLNGPVCEECKTELRWAEAWLKRADIRRPLVTTDLNEHLKKRLKIKD